jgi:hypothetical protein
VICKQCATRFHYCHNCGYDADTHSQAEGYCSDECLIAGGGQTYEAAQRERYEADEAIDASTINAD